MAAGTPDGRGSDATAGGDGRGGLGRAAVAMAPPTAAGGPRPPDLVDVETVAVLRKRWLAGTISDRRFVAAIADLEELSLDRYPTLPFMRRAYDLRANVTAYDAAYVGLAEGLGCELLTADRRLAGAPGLMCVVRVL